VLSSAQNRKANSDGLKKIDDVDHQRNAPDRSGSPKIRPKMSAPSGRIASVGGDGENDALFLGTPEFGARSVSKQKTTQKHRKAIEGPAEKTAITA